MALVCDIDHTMLYQVWMFPEEYISNFWMPGVAKGIPRNHFYSTYILKFNVVISGT